MKKTLSILKAKLVTLNFGFKLGIIKFPISSPPPPPSHPVIANSEVQFHDSSKLMGYQGSEVALLVFLQCLPHLAEMVLSLWMPRSVEHYQGKVSERLNISGREGLPFVNDSLWLFEGWPSETPDHVYPHLHCSLELLNLKSFPDGFRFGRGDKNLWPFECLVQTYPLCICSNQPEKKK